MNSKAVLKSEKSSLRKITDCAAISGTASVVAAAALLAIAAALVARFGVPHELMQPITTVLAAAATLVSSYLAGKKTDAAGLPSGLLTGAFVFAAVLALSMITDNFDSTAQTLVKAMALLSAGGAGSLAAAKTKRKTVLKI